LFPKGAFAAQDDENDDQWQNFKIVPWEAIAQSGRFPLIIDTKLSDPDSGSGDCDGDAAVTLADYARLARCWTGPRRESDRGLGPQYLCIDLDGDNDVNLADYAMFQAIIEQ